MSTREVTFSSDVVLNSIDAVWFLFLRADTIVILLLASEPPTTVVPDVALTPRSPFSPFEAFARLQVACCGTVPNCVDMRTQVSGGTVRLAVPWLPGTVRAAANVPQPPPACAG